MKFKDKKLGKIGKLKNHLFGLFWFLFGIVILISVLSFNEADISFNNVSTIYETKNYLGSFGSHLSDLLLQLFGLSSLFFAGLFIIVGYKVAFNKTIYNKWQKIFAFIGLLISSSIIFDITTVSKFCSIGRCGGVVGSFLTNTLYYLPQFLLLLLSGFLFFISISFFLDIRKNWWLVKTAKLYRLIKYIIFGTLSIFKFLFKLFTTKNFRERLKRFFINMFNRQKGDFVLIDDEEDGEDNGNESEEETKESKEDFKKKKISIFGLFNKKKDNNISIDIEDRIILPKEKQAKSNAKSKSSSKHHDKYVLPNLSLLNKNNNKNRVAISKEELFDQSEKLLKVLRDFGVKGEMISVKAGPIITLHEFEPSAGTKSSRVIGLSDDIARSMSAVSARISVIPGKNAMGIELPNKQRETIYIRDLLDSSEYKNSRGALPIIIGSDIAGGAVVADLAKMPHLLVAGTTGSGKSVAINTMITSLLYRMTPDQCKFIMIDPKMLELSVYEGIPHLLTPVVTEPVKAITALKWVCREMEDRYRIMASLGVRNIAGYNEKLNNAIKNGTKLTRRVQVGFDTETDDPIYEEKEIEEKEMPYIVVIVDEMADLMITAGKEIEASIQRIAQKARAAGIHLIMATQRPSVDVITGVIKANFPTRMSFQVVSKIDSRTILGEQGAEQLLGMGDMLFMAGGGKIIRAHGPFVSDDEVEKIVNFIKSQGFEPNYVDEVLKNDDEFASDNDSSGSTSSDGDLFGYEEEKDLYKQALAIVKRDRKCSISYIQRQLRIGYNKAANLVEEMERNGVLSAPGNTGKREILIKGDE